MKKLLVVAAVLACAVSCKFVTFTGGAKGIYVDGEVITHVFDSLTPFHALEINGHADVKYFQADDYTVTLEVNKEVLEYFDFTVKDSTLVIKAKDNRTVRATHFEVTVHAPQLTRVEVNGAADFDIDEAYEAAMGLAFEVNGAGDLSLNTVKVPALSIEVKGAGDIKVADAAVGLLEVSISGAGDAEIAGKADKASLSVAGAGDIDLRALQCEDIQTHKGGLATIRMPKGN